ncbi:MAG: DUF2079 domain-containing protein [Candidatus Limnocylindrales bacterium]
MSTLLAGTWGVMLLVRRGDGLMTAAYDLGFFQQLVWRIGQDGQWVTSFANGSFLGLHFSPILWVWAMLERGLWSDARLLSVVHALSLATLIPTVFLFLRAALRPSRLAPVIAAGLAVAVPFWAVNQQVLQSDFHPELLGVALAIAAGWAGLSGRTALMWALGLAALTTREDVSYAVVVIGLAVWALGRGSRARRRGMMLAGVGGVWAVVVFAVVMPYFRGDAVVDTASYYAWLGSGPGILVAPLTRGAQIVAALTREGSWFVVTGLIIGLAGLPLLGGRWLLLLAPPLAASLLSAHEPQPSLLLQYPIILLTPAIVAAAMGIRRVLRLMGRRARTAERAWPAILVGLALPAFVVAGVQASAPPFEQLGWARFSRPAEIDALRSVAAMVPADALLIVDEGSLAPLANRHRIAVVTWPRPIPFDAYILVDREAWSPSRWAVARRDVVLRRLFGEHRPSLADDGRFTLLGPRR